VLGLLITADVVPSSPILVTLMVEGKDSPKRLFLQEPRGATSQKTAFFIGNTQLAAFDFISNVVHFRPLRYNGM
jgi:hypothetical protein